MGPRPEDLERDIAFAREQLRRDVDELVGRVRPKAVVARQTEKLTQRAQGTLASVGPLLRNGRDQVLSRPALLGVGAGLTVLTLVTVVWRVRARR